MAVEPTPASQHRRVSEAKHYTDLTDTATHAWLTNTVLSGYEGSAYLHALPDIDLFLQPDALDDSPTNAITRAEISTLSQRQ